MLGSFLKGGICDPKVAATSFTPSFPNIGIVFSLIDGSRALAHGAVWVVVFDVLARIELNLVHNVVGVVFVYNLVLNSIPPDEGPM
jgi:hypothetical protein